MFNDRMFQNHIRRIVGLENTEAKVLLNHYREAFNSLQVQLMMAQDNTFTEAKLETLLHQLNVTIESLEHRIKNDMQESFNFMYENGVEDSVTEINKLEKKFNGISQLVPISLILESTNPDRFLFNNYESSVRGYNQDLRATMQHVLTQGLIQKRSLSQVVADMGQSVKLNEWKLHRIVRTELHQIYNVSKMSGMGEIKKKFLPDLKKSLVHPMDERTAEDSKELAQKNPIIDIEKPFVQHYNGKEIKFMAPPNRPNDRAILIPIRDSYDTDK